MPSLEHLLADPELGTASRKVLAERHGVSQARVDAARMAAGVQVPRGRKPRAGEAAVKVTITLSPRELAELDADAQAKGRDRAEEIRRRLFPSRIVL